MTDAHCHVRAGERRHFICGDAGAGDVAFYGVHPWDVREDTDVSWLDAKLSADSSAQVGEIGLDRLRERPLTTLQLAAAKKQLIGQVGVAADNFESTALGMAKTFLHYGEYEGSEALYRRIEALTAQQLWDIANELFPRDNLSVLIYR